MRVGATLAGVFVSLVCISAGALAADTKKNSAMEYGKTLPPIGFVKFCASSPADCKPKTGGSSIPMTPERWKLVSQVNAYVNGKIAPVSDQDLYGEPEHWAYPTDAGDCEDYVLLKKRYLEKLGFSREALLITVALDEKREGHAILTLATESGDYILDNRNNDLLRWNSTNYKMLKRQSHKSPLEWVALVKQNPSNSNIVFGGN
jgi:predicted transglutaminase-like cysteine proteinase